MQRGEVWWVNFDPSIGGEIKKQRPAVIISNNAANKYLNRVQVVPLSTQVKRLYASEALVTFNNQSQKVMADQVTTVSKLRLKNCAGQLSAVDLVAVERVIKLQLGLAG